MIKMKEKKYITKVYSRIVGIYNQFLSIGLSQKIINNKEKKIGVVFYFSPNINSYGKRTSPFMLMMLPIAYALSKKNYMVKFMVSNNVVGLKRLNKSAIFYFGGKFNSLKVKINKKITQTDSRQLELASEDDFEYDGVNYYEICLAQVRHYQKKYRTPIECAENKKLFKKFFAQCIDIHNAMNALNRDKSRNNKIIVIGNESNHLPNAAVWWYSIHQKNKNIQYIDYNRGYQHYWGKHFRDLGMSVRNVTKYKENRMYVSEGELESEKNKSSSTNINSPLPQRENKRNISDYVELGLWSEVFCLYTHVMYDVKIPDYSGEFSGMVDWINEMCKYFKFNKNKLLIIKPHPSEASKIKSKVPNEKTKDVIEDEYLNCENIVVLPAEHISGVEENINCGLVWRSSVGLELAIKEIPVVLFGLPDYQYLPFIKCHKKKEIKNILTDKYYLRQDNELSKKCSLYLNARKERIRKLNTLKYSERANIVYYSPLFLFRALTGLNSHIEKTVVNEILDEIEEENK